MKNEHYTLAMKIEPLQIKIDGRKKILQNRKSFYISRKMLR